MKRTSLTLLMLFSLAPALHAADTCESNFKTSGDPRNGASFETFITIPGLDNRSAIGQMEKIGMDKGFKVGAEDYSGPFGTLTLIQKESFLHQGFPITVTADKSTGELHIATRLNRGQTAKPENISSAMCGMLAEVKTGPEGDAIAAQARATTHTDEVVNVKAIELADKVRRDFNFHMRQSDVDIAAAKYVGRTYRIDGQVSSVNIPSMIYGMPKSVTLFFQTKRAANLLTGSDTRTDVTLACELPISQLAYVKGLRPGDYATVTGKVSSVGPSIPLNMTLGDCMPATPAN